MRTESGPPGSARVTTAVRLPLARPFLDGREEQLVAEVLRSGILSLGPMTRRFEDAFAERVGRSFAIACSSGTGGLHAALHAAGIRQGDEVITPSFSFISSANVILYCGATPVFVDVDDATLTVDPQAVAAAVTERTRALLPVHIFGIPCEMPALMRTAAAHGLAVVEDGCEALLASRDGAVVGGDGNPTVYAFYADKQVTTGEGGMITTDDERLDATLRSLINQGRAAGGAMAFEQLGFNYRMSDVTAAIGVGQLEKVDFLLAERERVAERYIAALAPIDGVVVRPSHPACAGAGPCSRSGSPPASPAMRSPSTSRPRACRRGRTCRRSTCSRSTSSGSGSVAGCCPSPSGRAIEPLVIPFFPGMSDEQIGYAVDQVRIGVERAS